MQHHHHLLKKMKEKGWHEHELKKAQDIFEKHKDTPHFFINRFDTLLHWLLFFLIILGNVLVVTIVVPLLVIFPNPGIYGILIVLGAMFGFLMEIVVKHINHLLGPHHHFVLGVIIPFLAMMSLFLIVSYTEPQLPNIFGLDRHPVAMGVIYAIAFAAPYLMNKGVELAQ